MTSTASMKKSIGSFERYCNDKVVKAEKFLDDHKNDPSLSARTVEAIEGMIKGLEDQFKKMETKWQDDIVGKVEDP